MSEISRYRFVRPIAVKISDNKLHVHLEDSRVISTPLSWCPWLAAANTEAQNDFTLFADAVYWKALDEGLEVEGMLRGIRPVYPQTQLS